jgi:hypothetical protein
MMFRWALNTLLMSPALLQGQAIPLISTNTEEDTRDKAQSTTSPSGSALNQGWNTRLIWKHNKSWRFFWALTPGFFIVRTHTIEPSQKYKLNRWNTYQSWEIVRRLMWRRAYPKIMLPPAIHARKKYSSLRTLAV